MKTAIVTTTINIPTLLVDYAENAHSHGHREVEFIVVGDRKSAAGTADFCRTVPHYRCVYLDIAAQERYLERFPELWRHLRFDSVARRNAGMLMAWENGADTAITIDDDNFVRDHDFIGLHGQVGSARELPAYRSSSGWFNVCSLLETENGPEFYHRGYPQQMRWIEPQHTVTCGAARRRIAANAGLWLEDPDIDAVARMTRAPVVRRFQPAGGSVALEPGTWSPFNSQNTALLRETLPAYWLEPAAGRYDDIWASYIVQRIAQHFDHAVSFGEPMVRQERNPHDLWRDLDLERDGMILTDDFCAALRGVRLTGTSYHECFAEIAAGLRDAWKPGARWTESQKALRASLLEGMEIWHGVMEKLGARRAATTAD